MQKIFGDITYLFLNIICPKLQHVLETRNHTLEYPFHSICSSTLGAWPPALIENMGLGGGGGGGGGGNQLTLLVFYVGSMVAAS